MIKKEGGDYMRKVLGLGFLTFAISLGAASLMGVYAQTSTPTATPTTTVTATPTGSVMGATTTPGAPATGFGY